MNQENENVKVVETLPPVNTDTETASQIDVIKWRLYAKFEGCKRFGPVDWSKGNTVGNLIYATVFTDAERGIVQKSLDHPENAKHLFEWRKI